MPRPPASSSLPLFTLPLLALPLLACTQIAELPEAAAPGAAAPAAAPAEPRPPVWLASEAAVFEHAQKVYEEAGFPEVRTAVFRMSPEVPLPFYQRGDRTLHIPPFTDGPERMRARLAKMSASHFSGALTFIEAFDSAAAAFAAYRIFMTIAVAHELAHHIQFLRKGAADLSPDRIYDIEAEAIEFEQAFLAHLVDTKQVPPTWRDHYRRSVHAIRDSLPRLSLDALPDDDTALREAFVRAYFRYAAADTSATSGVHVELSAAATVYAGYTRKRIALLIKPGRSLREMAAAEANRRTSR